jgi:hypothetical protein
MDAILARVEMVCASLSQHSWMQIAVCVYSLYDRWIILHIGGCVRFDEANQPCSSRLPSAVRSSLLYIEFVESDHATDENKIKMHDMIDSEFAAGL